jgi:uncharacterized protein (TIGR03083 family)
MSPESRANLKRTIRAEYEGMLALLDDPAVWEAPTGAGHWQARDCVGHLVDTTETYFLSFNAAAGKGDGPAFVSLVDMAVHVDEGAQQFRAVPREELLARLRKDFAQIDAIFDDLSDGEWGATMVPHKYMGPLPAFFYPIFQLVDYAVHSWDIREGIGKPHALGGDSADLLVPLIYVLWSATGTVGPDTEPMQVGIRVTSGHNAAESTVAVSPAGVAVTGGINEDLPAIIEFDPASLVLTGYGRTNTGTVRGDIATAQKFLAGFFRI